MLPASGDSLVVERFQVLQSNRLALLIHRGLFRNRHRFPRTLIFGLERPALYRKCLRQLSNFSDSVYPKNTTADSHTIDLTKALLRSYAGRRRAMSAPFTTGGSPA